MVELQLRLGLHADKERVAQGGGEEERVRAKHAEGGGDVAAGDVLNAKLTDRVPT